MLLEQGLATNVTRAASDGRQVESPVMRSSCDRLPALPLRSAPAAPAAVHRRCPLGGHDLGWHPARRTGHVVRGYGEAAVGAPVLAVGGSLELGHPDPRLVRTTRGVELTIFMTSNCEVITSSITGASRARSFPHLVDKIRGGDGAAVLVSYSFRNSTEASAVRSPPSRFISSIANG